MKLTTHDKALRINLDPGRYGTFAEIGAGQEVARWFFRVGGASGTVAKTISAYDMAVSDATYGPAERYVSRQRLEAMLECEGKLLVQQLAAKRGDKARFFVFADTVATRGYKREGTGNGWLGVRFLATPGANPSEILIHVHLLDNDASREQEALGILGVNLLHGAFYESESPSQLIASLMDGLARDRIEIDMIKLCGPAFEGVDNRLMSLQLVDQGCTDAAMFTADGAVVQPSEVLYKRPILVQRGAFRPITNRTLDLFDCARAQFLGEPEMAGEDPVMVMEMTLRTLTSEGQVDPQDFLARAEVLHALGCPVLISNCDRYFSLVEILSRYTSKLIGVAAEMPTLRMIAEPKYYADLPGGLLEAMGRLFRDSVKMYIYPYLDPQTGIIQTAETMALPESWRHLHKFLIENGRLESLRQYQAAFLRIEGKEVLRAIQAGDPAWEAAVPAPIVEIIKGRELFGYRKATTRNAPRNE